MNKNYAKERQVIAYPTPSIIKKVEAEMQAKKWSKSKVLVEALEEYFDRRSHKAGRL